MLGTNRDIMSDFQRLIAQTPILVVDDDQAHLKTLSAVFKQEGLTSVCCRTGQEALSLCKDKLFPIIILDLKLPDTEGLDLFGQLKTLNPQVRIIIHTGYATVESAMAAVNQGISGAHGRTHQMFAYGG